MDGAALPPGHAVGSLRYLIISVLLGAAGSMGAVAAFGSGTYRVGPLIVEMTVSPASEGTTTLGVRPAIAGLNLGTVTRKTHSGFLSAEGTVVGVAGDALIPAATAAVADPETLATYIRDQGKDAFRRFGLKVGLATLGGGAVGGAAIALWGFRLRRVFQGLIGGVVLVGALGIVAWQTYDVNKFQGTSFGSAATKSLLPG